MKDIRTRHLSAALGTAILLVAVAGCATAPPGASGTPTPSESAPVGTPSPSIHPTPHTTPTQEPEPEPSGPALNPDVATWLITEQGIGPFEIGMAWDDAVAVAEQLGWDTSSAGDQGGCAPSVSPGYAVGAGGLQLHVWKGESDVDDVTLVNTGNAASDTPRPKTEDGLSVFSTVDEVRSAHPGAAEDSVLPDGGRAFVTANEDGEGGRLHFTHGEVEPGVVDGVSVNLIAQPSYEHC